MTYYGITSSFDTHVGVTRYIREIVSEIGANPQDIYNVKAQDDNIAWAMGSGDFQCNVGAHMSLSIPGQTGWDMDLLGTGTYKIYNNFNKVITFSAVKWVFLKNWSDVCYCHAFNTVTNGWTGFVTTLGADGVVLDVYGHIHIAVPKAGRAVSSGSRYLSIYNQHATETALIEFALAGVGTTA